MKRLEIRDCSFTESEPAGACVFLDHFSNRNCIVTPKFVTSKCVTNSHYQLKIEHDWLKMKN